MRPPKSDGGAVLRAVLRNPRRHAFRHEPCSRNHSPPPYFLVASLTLTLMRVGSGRAKLRIHCCLLSSQTLLVRHFRAYPVDPVPPHLIESAILCSEQIEQQPIVQAAIDGVALSLPA